MEKNDIFEKDHDRFCHILEEAEELRYRKLYDYGKSYNNFGTLGVAVRMSDKMARIQNILKTNQVHNESLRDSFIDLINYAAMGVMTIDQENNNAIQ